MSKNNYVTTPSFPLPKKGVVGQIVDAEGISRNLISQGETERVRPNKLTHHELSKWPIYLKV